MPRSRLEQDSAGAYPPILPESRHAAGRAPVDIARGYQGRAQQKDSENRRDDSMKDFHELVVLLRFLLRVLAGPHEVQRHVRFIPYYPAIVARRDVEHVTGLQLNYPAIVHGRRRPAGDG